MRLNIYQEIKLYYKIFKTNKITIIALVVLLVYFRYK